MKLRLNNKHDKVAIWIFFGIFVFYSFTLLYPFFNALMTSLKGGPNLEYAANPFALPEQWLFSNYAEAFRLFRIGDVGVVQMFINSINLTVGGTFIGLLSSTLSAYVLAKYRFKLNAFLFSIAVFIMVIPVVGSLPAMYKLLVTLRFINNPFGILLTYASGFSFNFLILYGFFKSVSWTYAEAAFVDGASDFYVFVRIMVPQAVPAFISIGIVSAIGIWNDYYTPFLYLDQYPTLAYGLFELQTQISYSAGAYPYYMAAVLMTTVPIVIVFCLFQKTIIENTVAGGLKG